MHRKKNLYSLLILFENVAFARPYTIPCYKFFWQWLKKTFDSYECCIFLKSVEVCCFSKTPFRTCTLLCCARFASQVSSEISPDAICLTPIKCFLRSLRLNCLVFSLTTNKGEHTLRWQALIFFIDNRRLERFLP